MAVILQGNFNRSRTANVLLRQLILEKKKVILIISKQYQHAQSLTWFKDISGTANICVLNPDKVSIDANGLEEGYVWVRSKSLTFVSCYLTPNEPITDFEAKLDGTKDAIQKLRGQVVVAGDFNAKETEWGMQHIDSREKRSMAMAARQGLAVLNKGTTPTRNHT